MDRPDVARIPSSPGVYRFVDGNGRVLYVGKAVRLRDRIASYFASALHPPRTSRMVSAARNVVWTECQSEREALLLERELVFALQPPFNVLLRTGKGYPGLTLSSDAAPRLSVWYGTAPGRPKDSFGPYPSLSGKALLDAASSAFHVRTCTDKEFEEAKRHRRPCLLGETGQCLAPCLGGKPEADHAAAVAALRGFLSDRKRNTAGQLEERMHAAAASEQFETAGKLRDQAAALRLLSQEQDVIGLSRWDGVAVGITVGRDVVTVVAVDVHEGSMRGITQFATDRDPALDEDQTREAVLAQVRAGLPDGRRVICGTPADGLARAPRGKRETGLVAFAERQAAGDQTAFATHPWLAGAGRVEAVVLLGETLEMDSPPWRIECVDVSHTGGRQQVASIIAMEDGRFQPGQTRTVRTEAAGDDLKAVRLAVHRRASGDRLGLPRLPDLLVIDGAAGQVDAAVDALNGLVRDGETAPMVVGLAKRLEEIWIPGSGEPIILSRGSLALRLLQALRDEAHRTAIGRHRRDRDRQAAASPLDGVSGLGPARIEKLRSAFGTDDAIVTASMPHIQAVLGKHVGEKVWASIHRTSQ